MQSDNPISLAGFLSFLARDAVSAQRQMNQAHAADEQQFIALLAALPEASRSLFLPLAPAPICLHNYELKAEVRLETRHEVKGHIRLTPLNLAYNVRYGTAEKQESSFHIQVEQVFLPDKTRQKKIREE